MHHKESPLTQLSPLSLTPCFQVLTLLALIALCSCAEGEQSSFDEQTGGPFGKADVTTGPVEKLSCDVDESFIRRGGFARFKVDARDSEGALSRNYQLIPQPEVGTRVVQRDQIIFDLDGLYTVKCCALDTEVCDQVAVQVGELAPALAVSIPPFTEGGALLKGYARDRTGQSAHVTVNGLPINVDEKGHFETSVATPTGLNRYDIIATGSDGMTSTRHVWSVGGPFHDIDSVDPSAIRLQLGTESYPLLSDILTAYFVQLADDASESDGLRVTQSGSSLGYQWEVTPSHIGLGNTDVQLTAGNQADELMLVVTLSQFQAFAQGKTRFGSGYWRERDVVVTADLYIEVPFKPHTQGVTIGQVKTQVERLDVQISDMPGFIEGILERIFKGSIQSKLVEMIESVGDQGLSSIVTRFEVQEQLELSPPFAGAIDLNGRVSELSVDDLGIKLGLSLSVDGETDPARVSAPGPIMTSRELPKLSQGAPYELAFHLDTLNRFLFSAWQTGGLDVTSVVEQPFGTRDRLLGDQRLTLFVTPMLPPVARMGERPGELLIQLGALQVDGILESDLAILNCAFEAGATLRTLLSSDQNAIFASSALDQLTADVHIAPAGWEKEPTRELVARIIETDIAPKYADLMRSLPIPQADLRSLGLESAQALTTQAMVISTSANSVTVSASIILR